MDYSTVYCPASTEATKIASQILWTKGLRILRQPNKEAGFVLLDVPSLGPNGMLRTGDHPETVLKDVSKNAILIGGGLDAPLFDAWQKIDLLKDEEYLQKNAGLTAYCALQVILRELPVSPKNAPMLVIGWGRIGKELSILLQRLGTEVSVASRKPEHLETITALGMEAVNSEMIRPEKYRVIINTAPAPIRLEESPGLPYRPIKIDLASTEGLPGDDVIRARGLPGKYAPESSGKLIAEAAMKHIKEYL